MMLHGRGRFSSKEIATGGLEKIQNGLVVERRRVRDIDHDVCPDKSLVKAFPGDRVNPGRGGPGYYFVPPLAQIVYELRSDKTATANHNEFHICSPGWSVRHKNHFAH